MEVKKHTSFWVLVSFFVGSKGYPVLRYNIEEAAIFQNIWVDHVSVNKLV